MNGSFRERLPHILILALALAILQLPRAGGFFARLAAPVFAADRGFLDFDSGYYPAGHAIRTDPARLYQGVEVDEASGNLKITAPANFVNLPLLAWLFVPFSFLHLKTAGWIMLACNVLCALVSLDLLLRSVQAPWLRWIITAVFVFSGPMMNAMNLGQTSPWILLLLVLMERALLLGRPVAAGLWLGVAALIKIPALFLIPCLMLRRQWRAAGAAAGVLAGAALISLLCYGWELHAQYGRLVFRANVGRAIAAHNSQSIAAFAARATTGASLVSWQPVDLPVEGRILGGVLALAVLAGAWLSLKAAIASYSGLQHGIFLCAGLLLSPLCWTHYGIFLLPWITAFAVVLAERSHFSIREWGVPGIAVVLINLPVLPVSLVRQFDDVLWFRLAVSPMFYGMSLLFAVCVIFLCRSKS